MAPRSSPRGPPMLETTPFTYRGPRSSFLVPGCRPGQGSSPWASGQGNVTRGRVRVEPPGRRGRLPRGTPCALVGRRRAPPAPTVRSPCRSCRGDRHAPARSHGRPQDRSSRGPGAPSAPPSPSASTGSRDRGGSPASRRWGSDSRRIPSGTPEVAPGAAPSRDPSGPSRPSGSPTRGPVVAPARRAAGRPPAEMRGRSTVVADRHSQHEGRNLRRGDRHPRPVVPGALVPGVPHQRPSETVVKEEVPVHRRCIVDRVPGDGRHPRVGGNLEADLEGRRAHLDDHLQCGLERGGRKDRDGDDRST